VKNASLKTTATVIENKNKIDGQNDIV